MGRGGKREGRGKERKVKRDKENGENGEEKRGNCKRGGGKLKWKGKGMKMSRELFIFWLVTFLKPLKFVWGVPKWRFLLWGKFSNLAHLWLHTWLRHWRFEWVSAETARVIAHTLILTQSALHYTRGNCTKPYGLVLIPKWRRLEKKLLPLYFMIMYCSFNQCVCYIMFYLS